MSDWHKLGAHRYRVIDGIVWLEAHGEFSVADGYELVDMLVKLQAARPDCGVLIDVRGGISMPAATRKVMAERAGEGPMPIPMAVIGASLPVRAMMTLLMNAIRVILRRNVPTAFLATPEEAVPWLRARAEDRAAQLAALAAAAK
jgi:hypothetical protein